MPTSARTKTDVPSAADHTRKPPLNQSAHVTDDDIARRAYDLYLARDCEPGHHVDDWLQAERELREEASSTSGND